MEPATQTSMVGYSQKPPYPQSSAQGPHHLDMILSRLQTIEQRLNHIGSAASGIADRLVGPVPEQVGDGPRPPIGGGLFHQLEQQVGLMEAAIDRAERQVARLA